jgi:hypothetical protein
MHSTTRLQKPDKFIINNGTKNLEYEIARNTKGERLWRTTKVQVQPGQGELVKHWDSWHSGMGWSRDETRDAQYAEPVFETSTGVTSTHRGGLYPGLALGSIGLVAGAEGSPRFLDIGGYTYAFYSYGYGYVTVCKIDPSDMSRVYDGYVFGSDFPWPAGQPTEFGGYGYVPSAGGKFKELTTIVGDLTAAFLYNGSTYTDNTANANAGGGTAFTLLGDNSDDYFYWGCATKFGGLWINMLAEANTELTLIWEYWNGAAWVDIVGPEVDDTTGFTADGGGWVTWVAAAQTDWALTTVNSVEAYFVRVRTSTAATTWPTATWTPPGDVWTDGPADRLAWHMGTAGKLLWRAGDDSDPPSHHVINSCSAVSSGGSGGPLTSGNWSDTADYVIGKPGRNINSLADLGRWLYVGKEEGLFASDADGNQTNAIDFVRNLIASTNCSDTIRWLGTLVTTHKTGLWQYTGVTARTIGIENLESNLSSLKGGRYTGLATSGQWLYVSYLVGSTYYLLAGRPGHEDEPAVVWHILSSGAQYLSTPYVSGLTTNPTLWLGMYIIAGASSLYYITLAKDGSPDPTDTAISFTTVEKTIDLPCADWGSPGTPKHGHMVEVVTDQVTGTGGSVKVYYGWDGATPSTQLGSTITTATRAQCFWAGGNTKGTHWGYRPQVRIGITGGAANNLRVSKVSLYCIGRPRKEDAIETTIRLADSLDGSRTAKVMYDDLDALVGAGVYAVRDPDDPAGGTFYAIVDNLAPTKGEQLGEHSGTEYVTVTLRKVGYA